MSLESEFTLKGHILLHLDFVINLKILTNHQCEMVAPVFYSVYQDCQSSIIIFFILVY